MYIGNPLLRHTVAAPKIAVVCERNPHIFYLSPELIQHLLPALSKTAVRKCTHFAVQAKSAFAKRSQLICRDRICCHQPRQNQIKNGPPVVHGTARKSADRDHFCHLSGNRTIKTSLPAEPGSRKRSFPPRYF